MHPASIRPPRGRDGSRCGYQRHATRRSTNRTLLAAVGCLAAALGCLAALLVAKLMTAYVILRDHPPSANGSGPAITVEPSEAARYPSQVAAGDSVVAIAAGETLTERQALAAGGCFLVAARQQARGRNTLIVAAVLGQQGTTGTILPSALLAGHDLVLALDAAIGAGVRSGSRDNPQGPAQGPPLSHDPRTQP